MFSITSESGRLRSAPLPRAALRSGGADDDDDDESVYSVSVQKTTFSDDRSHDAGHNRQYTLATLIHVGIVHLSPFIRPASAATIKHCHVDQ